MNGQILYDLNFMGSIVKLIEYCPLIPCATLERSPGTRDFGLIHSLGLPTGPADTTALTYSSGT